MNLVFLLFTLFISCLCDAQNQYQAIDEFVIKNSSKYTNSIHNINYFISKNFTSDEDKTRALFILISKNYTYDYDLKNSIDKNISSGFSDENKLKYILKNKKGVCDNFAILFNECSKKLGLKSVYISGICKYSDGKILDGGHAWNAVKLKDKWYIIDATWGTEKSLPDSEVYLLPSSKAIQSYYPSDYLWQFSDLPITENEFVNSKNKSKLLRINHLDLFTNFELQDSLEREKAIIKRIEIGGFKNANIKETYEYHVVLAQKYELDQINYLVTQAYIGYSFYVKKYNKNGNNLNLVKEELTDLLSALKNELNSIQYKLDEVKKYPTSFNVSVINTLENNIDNLRKYATESKNKLEKY